MWFLLLSNELQLQMVHNYILIYSRNWLRILGKQKVVIFRVVLHLFTGSLAGIGKLPALAGWYIPFGIFCTVRFGGSSILWNFAGTPFFKFSGNLFFPQKGGLVHQKVSRSLPSREKRGSCQMYNTETSRPSFPLVLVGKIPGKYQPIPNWNTISGYNSSNFQHSKLSSPR